MSLSAMLAAMLALGAAAAPRHDGVRPERLPVSATLAAVSARARIPSFARQMKLSCGVCHQGGFPQLTRFGRLFKLNGYTLSGLPQIVEQLDSSSRRSLELSPIPGLSLMGVVSSTRLGRQLPGTPSTRAEYPQQLSLLFGGEISPKLGALAQLTYSDASGSIAMDNADVRFATHGRLGRRDVLFGMTLHNNPTVQDVWNTAPAWSFPFMSAGLAPRAAATTLIDGGLAQSVLGLGTYALYDNTIYLELSAYTSAPQGGRALVDSSATNTTRAPAPYWRLAVQNRSGPFYLMLGAYGLSADLFPSGASGPTNRYRDVGVDAQFERSAGSGAVIGRASLTHEAQSLRGFYAASPRAADHVSNTLNTFRANVAYGPNALSSFTIGYFATTGSSDLLRFAPAPVTGSGTGSPDTRGSIGEVTVSPWLNTRLGLQYTAYLRFNGSASSYDIAGVGRSARDNNTLYAYFWFAF